MRLEFFAGLLLSLLPARFLSRGLREWHVDLRKSAVASGILQLLFCLALLIFRYPRFVDSQMSQIDSRVFLAASAVGGDTTVRGFGLILLFAYVLTPLSLVLIYFAIEGLTRFTASVATGEVVGTLPLHVVDLIMVKLADYKEEKRQGPRIPDLVSVPPIEGSGYDLAVASCRNKPNWNHLMTISYNDTLYEVADYLEAAPPRRHVYLLRRAPEHKVVRGLHHYDPNEVL